MDPYANSFDDPELHRLLGQMVIRFAMLETVLGNCVQRLGGDLMEKARVKPKSWPFGKVVDELHDLVESEGRVNRQFAELHRATDMATMKEDLLRAAEERNWLIHGFWSFDFGQKAITIRRQLWQPETETLHLTHNRIQDLIDRLGVLRGKITAISNNLGECRRAEAEHANTRD